MTDKLLRINDLQTYFFTPEGVVRAAEKTGIDVPVVVRMEGTNVEEGRKILADSGLSLITATNMKDAAEKVAGSGRGCDSERPISGCRFKPAPKSRRP